MQVNSVERRIPLPKHWPRCVRSAVVHAVSMANVAFTVTQARVENHSDAVWSKNSTDDQSVVILPSP